MKKWNLVIDVARCENCNNCVLATKDEHIGNDFPGYAAPQPRHGHNWIQIKRRARGTPPMADLAHVPTMCNHCDAAPCIAAARGGAIYKRDDGIVIIDPKAARGRRDLVDACPYHAIWWNEELQLPQIWIFDAHLMDQGWKSPRCVQACGTGAMRSFKVDDEEMQEMVRAEGLEPLQPKIKTKPRVYYKNLHRYTKCFIGGSVVAKSNNVVDCVSNARAVLLKDGKHLSETASDTFGDFKFDALSPSSGRYCVEITHAKFGRANVVTELGEESTYLGDIVLSPGAAI